MKCTREEEGVKYERTFMASEFLDWLVQEGDAICFRPSAVPAAPSSWSLDSGAREAQPFLSAHTGCILAPPVPPRSLLHGKKTSSGSPR